MLTQRQAIMGIFILETAGALGLLIGSFLMKQEGWIITLASLIVFAGLSIAYWCGISWVRFLNIMLVTLTAGFGIQGSFLTSQFSPATLAVPILILILADWRWMVGSAILLQSILIWRAAGQGPYASFGNIAIIITAIGGMVIVRLITESAQLQAEHAALKAAEAAENAQQNALALKIANDQLNEQLNTQQRLLDLVGTLETPAVGIGKDVLLAPLIGHLDSRRAEQVTQRLLNSVNERHTKLLILDITGVPVVDTEVAVALLRVVRTVSLLGCRVVLTGITASVAISITKLGIDLGHLETARDPQEALNLFLGSNTLIEQKTMLVNHKLEFPN
ncbi:MAG: STAS domain-containing protein [Oscillochloris sp.]|nr:STAS domain-containing protein [Oscillochloris sp.]